MKCGVTASLTTWHHNICQSHRGLDVLFKGWLHKLVVLFDHSINVPASLCDVPPEPPYQPDVRIGVHKDLHVQQLRNRQMMLQISSVRRREISTL